MKLSKVVSEEKRLTVALKLTHGTEIYALLENGATRNGMSTGLTKYFGLKREQIKKVRAVAICYKAGDLGEAVHLPVHLEKLVAKVDFVIVKHVLFELISRHSTIQRL